MDERRTLPITRDMAFRSKKYIRTAHPANHAENNKSLFRRSLVVVLLFTASYGVGFTLVISFYHPDAGPTPNKAGSREAGAVAVAEAKGLDSDKATPQEDAVLAREASAPAEVPPGKIPDGVVVSGPPLYFICWDAEGNRQVGRSCDSLKVLEKRFRNRLHVVDSCKRRYLDGETEGILSLGVQVDFSNRDFRAWSAPSSDLPEAEQIGRCIRRELKGFPLHRIDHEYERYRLFFTVEFKNPRQVVRRLEKLKRRSREVHVSKDRVRVRMAPEDGYVIGKVSREQRVRLLEKRDEWCRVLIPDRYQGWMICEALVL